MATVKPPQPPDSMKVEYLGTYGGATWAVVHWIVFSSTGDPSVTQVIAVVDDLIDAFGNNLIHSNYFSTSLHLSRVKATYRLQSGTGAYRTVRIADVTGNHSGAGEPAQVSYLINWDTLDDRKGGKARSYIPGVPDEWVENETSVTGPAADSLTSLIETYLNTVQGLNEGPLTGAQLVEMSFRDAGAFRDDAVFFPIYSGSVNTTLATQRRRLDRARV